MDEKKKKPAKPDSYKRVPRKPRKNEDRDPARSICVNPDCRMKRAGCRGAEGCPGFKGI